MEHMDRPQEIAVMRNHMQNNTGKILVAMFMNHLFLLSIAIDSFSVLRSH